MAIIDGKRWCPKCTQMVPIENYHKNKGEPDGLRGWCKLCSLKYQRKYRQTSQHKEYWREYRADPEYRRKHIAQCTLNNAVNRGKIDKPDSCSKCGSVERIQAHHESYEAGKELDVTWLCRSCHTALHLEKKDDFNE